MTDYFATQLTGSRCQGRNCACASCAMAIAYGTNYAVRISADRVRTESGDSCVPGVHSASGGLYVSDVIRVARKHGVYLNYNLDANDAARAWPSGELVRRCGALHEGAIVLGHYGSLPSSLRVGSFTGDHSCFAHDYRTSDDTFCFHDPLRRAPIRLKRKYLIAYWFGGRLKGLAGFVAHKPVTYRYTTARVYLRTGPRTSAARIELMPSGAKLAVLAKVAGGTYSAGGASHSTWYKVRRVSDGKVGYCAAYFTRS